MEIQNLLAENGLLLLSPDVRTIEKVGSTGSGKTYVDLLLTTPLAFKVLSLSVGEGSATLRDQTKVYTEKLTTQIVVAAKLSDEIYSWAQLIEMVLKVLTKVVKANFKNSQIESLEHVKENLIKELLEALNTTRNTEAQPRILSEVQRRKFADEIAEYTLPFLKDKLQTVYFEAKNMLTESEAKPNSRKLDEAISQRLQLAIDNELKIIEELKKSLESINKFLKAHFLQFFNENQKSKDGYYYFIIDLNHQDDSKPFIKAMFTNNNLTIGEQLSIEVLCSDLVIYAPMNDEAKRLIRENPIMESALQGMDGSISLGIRDTRGMYHESADQKKEFDHLQELLYDRTYDALMLVCPIFGDNNHAKLREDVKLVLKNYSKQTPIIILSNKVDLLIDDRYKESNQMMDLFEIDGIQNSLEIPFHELQATINQRIDSIHKEFTDAQQKRHNGVLVTVPCYLKPPSTAKITRNIYEAYGPKQALHVILTTLTNSLASTSEKVQFNLNVPLENALPFEINKQKIREGILSVWLDPENSKKVQQPALQNIEKNRGITPHGQGYNALGYNYLPKGRGWTSNIDEGYFINCKSFSITFPANLRNLMTTELVGQLIDTSVIYQNGNFKTTEGQNKLKEIVQMRTFRSNIFVANVLYDNAFKKADKAGFSYNTRFKKFLDICEGYFKIYDKDLHSLKPDQEASNVINVLNIYTEALAKELEYAISLAFRLHVYLK